MSKPVEVEVIEVKQGRFQAIVTKEYYNSEEDKKAQVEALKLVKALSK